jgi:hypothetical protein
MGVEPEAGSGMQFDQVEAPAPSGPPACSQCHRPLDEYFALGGHMFCRTCVDGYKRGGSFWRALAFGVGAAALGSFVWYLVSKASNGSSFGIIGIAVGLFIGFAVRKGTRGLGGPGYQALAMALTYVAITTSYVPQLIEDGAQASPLLFVFTLAAPFMGGVGFIGWIIIGIALYEAWKLNRRVPITGPFRFGGALSVPAPAPVTPGPPAAPGS